MFKSQLIVALLVIAMFVAGVSLLLVNILTFTSTLKFLQSFAADGKVDGLTPDRFSLIQFYLTLLGVGLVFFGGAALMFRRPITKLFSLVFSDAKIFAYDILAASRRWSSEVGAAERLALLILIGTAVAIRLLFISRGIYYDEAFSLLTYIDKPLFVGLSNYSEPNNHLFHTLLVHLARDILGESLAVLRLPAFLSGLALLVAGYTFAYHLHGHRTAVIMLGLLVCSSSLIEYSTIARGYSLVTLLTLLIFQLAFYLVSHRNTFVVLLLSILAALGFYTIPIFLFSYVSCAVWVITQLLISQHRLPLHWIRYGLISSILTGVLTFLLYSPALIASGASSVVNNVHVAAQSRAELSSLLIGSFVWTWEFWNRDFGRVITLGLSSFAVLGFLASFKDRAITPILISALTGFLVCLAQSVVPFRRVWIIFCPFYLLAIAEGLSCIITTSVLKNRSRAMANSLALLISIVGSVLVWQQNYGEFRTEQGTLNDLEPVTELLKSALKPEDRILALAPADYPLKYKLSLSQQPLRYFESWQSATGTLYIVHNLSPNFSKDGLPIFERLSQVLSNFGLDPKVEEKLEKLSGFRGADVYKLDRANISAASALP